MTIDTRLSEVIALERRLIELENEVARLRVQAQSGQAAAIVTDHGGLTGLASDDHVQYLNELRAAEQLEAHILFLSDN